MANIIDCTLDVQACSPKEINDKAKALREPSTELVNWTTAETQTPPDAASGHLHQLVEFHSVTNLGYIAEDLNMARRFANSFKATFTV
jgi:hypothetical protein